MTSHGTVPLPDSPGTCRPAVVPMTGPVADSSWTHETSLAAEHGSASLARDFVGTHLGEHGLPHLVDDIRLVVSELATNAILHAGTTFIVRLTGDDLSVLLTVHDGSLSAPVQLPISATARSGRGMAIVDLLSQDWGVLDAPGTAKNVWARFSTN